MEPLDSQWWQDSKVHAALISGIISFAVSTWAAKKARAASKGDAIKKRVEEVVSLACEHWCGGFKEKEQDRIRAVKIQSQLRLLAHEVSTHKKLNKCMGDFRSSITKDFENQNRQVCSLDGDPRIDRIHEKADEIRASFK